LVDRGHDPTFALAQLADRLDLVVPVVAETETLEFAGLVLLVQRFECFFEWRFPIRGVKVVEVDTVHPEGLERLVEAVMNVLLAVSPAMDVTHFDASGTRVILGRDLEALILDLELGEILLTCAFAVHAGRIELMTAMLLDDVEDFLAGVQVMDAGLLLALAAERHSPEDDWDFAHIDLYLRR